MITINFTPGGAVRSASAIKGSVERMRDFCRETDSKFGSMNNIYRDAIDDMKKVHLDMLVALRAAGYFMTDDDIEDDPIDEKIAD